MSEDQELRAASYLFLEDSDQILLMKRRNTGFRDGYWSLVAGHVDKGEDFREAMVRETKEEAGIEIDRGKLTPYTVMHRSSDDNPYVDLFFHLSEWEGEIENMEPEKCEKLEWFPIDDLPEKTIPFVRKAIEDGGEKLEYMESGWN